MRAGQTRLGPHDFEVVVLPPPRPPRRDLLRSAPCQTATDALGWLIRGGRGSTTKRARLAHGFWLVLRERRSPTRSTLVLLSATHEQQRLTGVGWFRVDEGGATARKEEAGSLTLGWAQDPEGFEELVSTTAATDLALDLRTARGPTRRAPVWRVRILAGSEVRWPRAVDGVRLAPRLRPARERPAGPT